MGTTSQKLQYLTTTKGKIKDAINLTNANILSEDTFRSYAEKLKLGLIDIINNGTSDLYDSFPKTTGEGTEIALNDTYEAPMRVDLNGNTEQDSYTGINKVRVLDKEQTTINNITYSVTDGIISWSGTASSNTGMLIEFNDITLPAGTYYFYLLRTKTTRVDISLRTTKNVMIDVANFGNAFQNTLSNKSFTLSSDTVMHSMNLYFPNGTDTTDTYKIMICTASHTATEYEPFVGGSPSPSPDYPQPIEVVTGDNTINIHGKNLLNPYKYNTPTTKNGITCTYDNTNQTYTFNGTCTANNTAFAMSNQKVEFTNGITTISAHLISGSVSKYCLFRTFSTNYARNTPINLTHLSNSEPITYAICNGTNYTATQISLRFEEGSVANNLKVKFMIADSTDTTYEPYQSQTYPINLGDIELCKIGDYQDYIYKENNKWYKHSEIGKVVLDGSEDWNYFGNMFYVDNLINDYLKENIITSICNQYKGSTNSATTQASYNNGNNTISFRTGDTLNRVLIRDDRYNSVVNLKPWLSSNNATVYYVLATPTNTEITDTELKEDLEELEKAKSVDDKTFISQINEQLPFILDVSALSKN